VEEEESGRLGGVAMEQGLQVLVSGLLVARKTQENRFFLLEMRFLG